MQKEKYDYIIIGSGLGGLSIGALLAHTGKKVLILEKYNTIGGYAHTITEGDYTFCHEVQYIMGCGPNQPVDRLIKKLNLSDKVQFNQLDNKAFDLMSFSGTRVEIPFGMNNYKEKLVKNFPQYKVPLDKYFRIVEDIYKDAQIYKKAKTASDILFHPFANNDFIKYRNYTLHDFFEEIDMPQILRSILAGQAGNIGVSPRHSLLLLHVAMQGGFCDGAYYPKKGMHHYLGELKNIIIKNNGSIITNCEVQKIDTENTTVTEVITASGNFTAENFISNIDPRKTALLTTKNKDDEKKYHYKYSPSAFSVYLGLKDLNLTEKGMKRQNIWHHNIFDINKEFDEQMQHNNFENPFLFISFPSLLTDAGILCPENSSTMEIVTVANYDYFKNLKEKSFKEYTTKKEEISNHFIDIFEKNYFPIRNNIDTQIIHTPLDVENILGHPKGNIYGSTFTVENFNILDKPGYKSDYENLYFVGATAAYPSVMGVTLGALDLFKQLH